MKTLIFSFLSVFLTAFSPLLSVAGNRDAGTPAPADSTVDVIGWFCKGDSLLYEIQESEWRITPTDTLLKAAVTTLVRVVVTDSTPSGYSMDYTLLDFRCDSVENNPVGHFVRNMTEMSGKRLAGTTVNFTTDDCGRFTGVTNYEQIRTIAESSYRDMVRELGSLPEVKALRKEGLDLTKLLGDMDSGELVESFTEELNLLFACHGNSYRIGESTVHEAASDSVYENDTTLSVWVDEDDGCYHVSSDVVSTIPEGDIKDILSGLVDSMDNPRIKESYKENFEMTYMEDPVIESYYGADFLPDGWPYKVWDQTKTMIGERGKVTQRLLRLISR